MIDYILDPGEIFVYMYIPLPLYTVRTALRSLALNEDHVQIHLHFIHTNLQLSMLIILL